MKRKSWKREIAAGLILLWVLVAVKIFFFAAPATVANYAAPFEKFTMIVIPLCLAAFGLHAYLNRPGGGA